MSYIVITTGGHLHVRDQTPTAELINHEVGQPGWDMVALQGGARFGHLMGWVNDSGHINDLTRNVAGSVALCSLGAREMPYAGPVVLTGWDPPPGAEIAPLTATLRDELQAMHADVLRTLGWQEGAASQQSTAAWQQWVRAFYHHVVTAPTPTIEWRQL